MNASAKETVLREAVDIWGSDFARWPEGSPVGEARLALLADRTFRARWESAAMLDRALAAARDEVDAEIAASGATERVLRALVARDVRPRRASRGWMAIAAALVLAAGLGSLIDYAVVGSGDGSYEMVVVDPLVFGTTAVETQ